MLSQGRRSFVISFFYQALIELTNGRWTSIILKKFAQSKTSRYLIPSFARIYNINLKEIEQDIREFSSLHEFFIRKLKKGERPIANEPNGVVSPVDAMMEDMGKIDNDLVLKIKGKTYSLLEMLGDEETTKKYAGGNYVLLYLSPSNYHRIHSPLTGKIIRQWTLGKKSYPVNKIGLKYGRDVLAKNYRKITEIECSQGSCAVVKVGAMFVNSIELTFQGENIKKGEEMAYFTFGSTVVLLFSPHSFEPKRITLPKAVKIGEMIGTIRNEKNR